MSSLHGLDECDLEKCGSASPVTPVGDDITLFADGAKSHINMQEATDGSEVEFPEGGLRAWLVVLGAWLLQFSTVGYINGYGAYNDYYVREYLSEHSSSKISWIGSTQLCLYLALGLVAGRGTDVGYYRHLMIGGCTMLTFCLFMLSCSQPQQFYQVFLAHGLGFGIAAGVTYVPGCAIVSHYFHRRRAFALGIMASGSAIGGAVHPIMLNNLFHGEVGFHNGVRASAGMLGGLLLISYFLLKPRLPPKSKHDGSILQDFTTFIRDPPYVLTSIGTPFIVAGIYYPIYFLQLEAIKNGIAPGTAFYTLVILNFANAVGRVTPTILVPKFGVFNLMVPCITVCGILTLWVLVLNTAVATIAFAAVYGFFTGAYGGLFAPMIASLARNDAEIGARFGICFTATGIGALLGSPIVGTLLSKHFIWWRPTLFSVMCTFTAALCFGISRFLVAKRKCTWRV